MTIPALSGDARDTVVQTLYFRDGGLGDRELSAQSAIAQHIAFVNVSAVGGFPIANDLASTLTRVANACTVKAYAMWDPIPRQPIWTSFFTLGPTLATDDSPRQLAMVLTYHADYAADAEGQPGVLGQPRPRARKRGRLYFGPLTFGLQDSSGVGEVRPNSSSIARLKKAATDLQAGVYDTYGGINWCVYSKTLNNSFLTTSGWIDNRFDIQRRRASRSTVRTTWP